MTKQSLETALKGAPKAQVRATIAKDARIDLRVSEEDKAHMQRAAQALSLTVTEYLTRCHYVVSKKLEL